MVIPGLIAAGIAVLTFWGSSWRHKRRVDSFLNRPLDVENEIKEETENRFGPIEAGVVGLAAFDVLYNIGKMDPFTLSGIDHLHHAQEFGSLGELTDYIRDTIISSESGSAAWRQMIHKYKGYTGEESAFDHIRDQGHDLDVPESGTNPDIDAYIDGQAYNMAITDNPAYIQDKLDSLPSDVGIWTNREMAEAFGDNPRVFIDNDLSSQESFHLTDETFSGIDDLGGFIDDIPVFTLVISSIRHGYGVYKGRKKVKDAVEQVILDTAGIGVGGWAGSEVGLMLGLALTPVTGGTSAFVIPAITTVLGTLAGIFTGKSITGKYKRRHLRGAIEDLESSLEDFTESYLSNYEGLLERSERRFRETRFRFQFAFKQSQRWFMRTFFPSVLARFYQLSQFRLWLDEGEADEFYEKAKDTIEEADDIKEAGLMLYSQGSTIFLGITEMTDLWDLVDEKIKRVEEEREKLI